jgi:OOP family OmpA-OmpF porin
VRPIESVGPLGTVTSDGKPDTRILTFRCGARPETPVAVVPLAPQPMAVPQKVTLSGDATFDTAKWTLRADARTRLSKLIEDAQGVTFGTVEVEGFTDSVGSDAYNATLSEQRANVVAAYLQYHGLQARRVVVEGRGKVNPIATNATAVGRSQNRRVEIRLNQN